MRKLILSLMLASIALASCTSESEEPGISRSSPEKPTQGLSSPQVPDILGLDLAKAVKKLQAAGVTVNMSSLNRIERSYGRQLIKGYWQSHPRVVVVDYTVSDPKMIFIERVACPHKVC